MEVGIRVVGEWFGGGGGSMEDGELSLGEVVFVVGWGDGGVGGGWEEGWLGYGEFWIG